MKIDYEAVIQGGGMVGLALALTLARAGLPVAVLEAHTPWRWRRGDPVDQRVSAISVASERYLGRLGAWADIRRARACPFHGIHAWDGEGGGAIHFDAHRYGEPHLGHIVENRLIQTTLWQHLSRHDNVRLMVPGSVEGWDAEPEGLRVRLNDGGECTTRLLVGADGARSRLRELAGIGHSVRPYGQHGVVGTVWPEHHHGGIARQRFLPTGPLALLPLADGSCSIVWSCPEAQATELLELPEARFREQLTQASEAVLGPINACGPRAAFPLRRSHARRYIDRRLALVGDAAHTIHPLAGQGVNLGFMDAATLAEEMLAAHARGRDPGGQAVLQRFQRRRLGANHLMQTGMDAFHWLFANDLPPLVVLRSLGLSLTDRLAPAKSLFMARAMGLSGELPALARPHPQTG
ncbi:UbiH/UbiF/VisC/COQ6 family ubiquinone biosynthesis hydroxylase [Alkalilimnicola ehrlichii]|uniref:UbiH/UbiF/VisC/COQ6 family ubiquinone biosynthesis hydroxylase n=1 Tax=Alkalilimnicola ehrlichii TaxID=351052 RepID=UPI003B9FB418